MHVDAGAYGATHGDHILRFFVNVNPSEDRVWATKGAFPYLYDRYGAAAGIAGAHLLERGALDHLRTGLLKGLVKIGVKEAMIVDSSPYDRLMRRFHNYMKDTPEFQEQMQYFRRRLLRDAYFEKQLKGEVKEAEAKAIYDQRVGQMPAEDEFAARHILVDSEAKARLAKTERLRAARLAQEASQGEAPVSKTVRRKR